MCSQSYLQHLLSLLYLKIGEIQPIYRREVLIEVKVPKEIRDCQESIFFGLSTKQFWYGRWRQGDLTHYADRRIFIQKLYQNILDTISKSNDEQFKDEFTPTGWDRVDRTIYEMKQRLAVASVEEQFQAIGMLGREALITIAQQVFDKEKHKTEDSIIPSDTDAKRMLDAFISFTLQDAANERQRKFAKASVDLANQLTHDRMAILGDAQICLTAVSAVASIIRILSER